MNLTNDILDYLAGETPMDEGDYLMMTEQDEIVSKEDKQLCLNFEQDVSSGNCSLSTKEVVSSPAVNVVQFPTSSSRFRARVIKSLSRFGV